MCKRSVQTGCTGYMHIAAKRMMENSEYLTVYKVESCLVNVIRPSSSLGA